MSPRRRHLLVAAALLAPALLAPAPARAAGDHGFQIEARWMGTQPIGHYRAQGVKASDAENFGGNAGMRALIQLNRRYAIGADIAYLKNQKDFTVDVDPRPSVTDIRTIRRSLAALPIDVLFEARTDTHRRVSGYAQGGVGITSYTLRLTGGFQPLDRRQQAFSWVAGGGAVVGINRDLEVVGGVDWRRSATVNGDIWLLRDDPQYLVWSLGMRYPRW
jgi:hypothetical protein